MKHLLLTTIAAVLLVGCGESQQSSTQAETKPSDPVDEVTARPSPPPSVVKPAEPVAKAAKPKPPTAKAPGISIHAAASTGNIEVVKQHIAAGTDVNAKDDSGWTPLHWAASKVHNKIAKLLIEEGADVNAVNKDGLAPLDYAENETFGVLIDHGAKSGEELKAEGK